MPVCFAVFSESESGEKYNKFSGGRLHKKLRALNLIGRMVGVKGGEGAGTMSIRTGFSLQQYYSW